MPGVPHVLPASSVLGEPAAHGFLRLACLTYGDEDSPHRWAEADRLLTADPGLLDDPAVAVACGAVEVVRAALAADPSLATAPAGPWGMPPLVYLAYARHGATRDADAAAATVSMLLEHGADPDAGFLHSGLVPPFTVLTGLFGEGEGGPERQPRHPHGERLARLLLSAGADPNDGQALYNRMFRADDSHLRLLLEFGLGTARGDGGAWRLLLGDALPAPAELLRDQLVWACVHGFTERVRLLARHGVDLAAPLRGGRTPTRLARESAQPGVVALLADLGVPEAQPPATGPDAGAEDLLAAYLDAALRPDLRQVAAIEAAHPGTGVAAREHWPTLVLRATVAGNAEAVRALAGLGFDVSAPGRMDLPLDQPWETPLHAAAWRGDRDLVGALLDAGADPTALDARFGSTPAGWARHGGHEEVAALLDAAGAAAEEGRR